MGFLERLHGYLERVERAVDGLPAVRVDMAAHVRHFAAASDAMRASEARRGAASSEADPDVRAAWAYADARRDEQRIAELRDLLPAFVDAVADLIDEEVAPNASHDELAKLINIAINWRLQGGDESTSGSRGLDDQIGELAERACSRLAYRKVRDGWESPARYAMEILALVRKDRHRHGLARSGAAFLELSGADAVRWLLALESAQSLGPMDDWRVSPVLAAQLLKEPQRDISVDELAEGSWRFSFATIRRLDAMKLLHYQGQDLSRGMTTFSYAVFESAHSLLEEVAEQRSTPFVVLADALLRDHVTQALDRARPRAEQALQGSAATSTALQAKMVVHEIRNALVPAQIAFARIDREIPEAQRESLQRHRGRVEAGIQRALTFAGDMLRVANLGTEPSAAFDAASAVRDAIAGVAGDLNGSLKQALPDHVLPMIVGPRARFVLAVTNLLRNAAQAVTGHEGTVEVSLEERDDGLVLRVDDNGPGVPMEQRRIIFEPGVTLRSGGSGQGLALVWQVIVGEMLGSAACHDSPLGGARFEIVLPVKGSKHP